MRMRRMRQPVRLRFGPGGMQLDLAADYRFDPIPSEVCSARPGVSESFARGDVAVDGHRKPGLEQIGRKGCLVQWTSRGRGGRRDG